MNERIQQLAEQARKYARDYVADCKHYGHYMEHNELEVKFEEKFAELIIGECIHKINDIAESSNNPQPIYRVTVDLLEHFGVEE
jgi:hypothetical protein